MMRNYDTNRFVVVVVVVVIIIIIIIIIFIFNIPGSKETWG